jgi:hypothetical protein
MNIDINVINRLFWRLSNTYGVSWDSMWSLNEINEIKELWVSELQNFSIEDFRWALDHLPEKPPNLIQFKKLLKDAPEPFKQYLPPPKGVPIPPEIKEKIDSLRKQFTRSN